MSATAIVGVGDFLARALAMEVEAAERYDEFAAQMELHNNLAVAALFHKLAGVERKHADAIAADLVKLGVAATSQAPLAVAGAEGVETALGDDLHYLMTPFHALEIALRNEERAFAFFDDLANGSAPESVRGMAREFAREEAIHVGLVRGWLTRVTKPAENWSYDPDAPNMPE